MDENTKPSALCRTLVVLIGIVVMLFGLVLLVGGVRLAQLGGSWYFLLMGAASLVAGGLLPCAAHWARCCMGWRSSPPWPGHWPMPGWNSGRWCRGW